MPQLCRGRGESSSAPLGRGLGLAVPRGGAAALAAGGLLLRGRAALLRGALGGAAGAGLLAAPARGARRVRDLRRALLRHALLLELLVLLLVLDVRAFTGHAARIPCSAGRKPLRRRRVGASKRREEVDDVAVGVDDVRVPLAPEGVVRRLLALVAGLDEARVSRVYVAGAFAIERERHAVAARLLALRVELSHQLLGVPHEPDPAGKLHVVVRALVGLRDVQAQQAVEADGRRDVAGDDPDRGEPGHERDPTGRSARS